jgi:uracil-DNA glycosylase
MDSECSSLAGNGRDLTQTTRSDGLVGLLEEIRACRICARHLSLGPRPVVQAARTSRLLIVGQAPSLSVHRSGVPWDDKSGKRLRDWLGIASSDFYDASKVAIVPMGLCYPGRGSSGDLPPRHECAPLWFDKVLGSLRHVELTLLVGRYAQRHVLGGAGRPSLTETVAAFAEFAPRYVPLPHPSPRNTGWLKCHPWFERELLPMLRARVRLLLSATSE